LVYHVFDGGILDAAALASVRLTDGELAHWRMVTRDEAIALLRPHMARRVAVCLDTVHRPDRVPGIRIGSTRPEH
jgi:hypothetical protein